MFASQIKIRALMVRTPNLFLVKNVVALQTEPPSHLSVDTPEFANSTRQSIIKLAVDMLTVI